MLLFVVRPAWASSLGLKSRVVAAKRLLLAKDKGVRNEKESEGSLRKG
ncbi:hypothetical protein NST74_07180 [Paenibacillus sp. FSL F4-0125]